MTATDDDPTADTDRDLFADLGADWGADEETLRRAWRAASRAAHPDTGGSHEEFLRVRHAWEVLSDPSRRSRYLRAYEARHGPQRPRPADDPARNGPTDGAESRRCSRFTRDGRPCRNPAGRGSDSCWQHDLGGPSGGAGNWYGVEDSPWLPSPWRCWAMVTRDGERMRCFYNRLVGSRHCWDHSDLVARETALAAGHPGQCAAVNQRQVQCGRPCSSLGLPVCDHHLTRGLLEGYGRPHWRAWWEYETTGADGSGAAPTAPGASGPHAARSGRRPTPSEPPLRGTSAAPVDSQTRRCPTCGRRNRIPPGARGRCGTCRADLADPTGGDHHGPEASPARPRATTPPPADAPTVDRTDTITPAATVRSRGAQDPGSRPTTPATTVAAARREPTPRLRRRPLHRPLRRSLRPGFQAFAIVLVLAAPAAGLIAYGEWVDRPRTIAFAEGVKDTYAECTSGEALDRDRALAGFEMTCTMVDDAPGNRDRPYVQLRLEGCDDWQRLDHDDGAAPVVITARLESCAAPPDELRWQVCQTHGGPLPDDCDDGTTDLPPR